jgi:hypothetical protein
MACEEPRLRAHGHLVAASIVGVVAEAGLLAAFGLRGSVAVAPQVTAPAPFGAFHDLRWLLVFTRSWVSLAGAALALLALRTALTTVFVGLAWPRDVARPGWRASLPAAALFTVVATVLLSPWAALLFGMAVTPVSWLFFTAVPTALVIALLIHPGAVTRVWWREVPPLRTTGWTLLTFLVLTMDGAALSVSPLPLLLPVAAAAGLFNAWAWLGLVHAIVCRQRPHHFVPLAPIGVALMLAVVAGGVDLGFAVVTARNHLHRAALGSRPLAGRPVLIVAGFGSSWDGDATPLLRGDYDESRFSYKGLDGSGRPLPYGQADTHRPLNDLVRTMAGQVDALYAATGAPVSIVAESEGALVAKLYAVTAPRPPVAAMILLSPLVEPARVYFPRRGHEGFGLAAAAELRGIARVLSTLSPVNVSTDTPLFRSIVDNAPTVRRLLRCPVPGVRQLALFPLADAVVAPHPSDIGSRSAVVPAFHGGLLTNPSVKLTIALELSGRRAPAVSTWARVERTVEVSAAAWQVPELPVGLNSAWPAPPASAGCGQLHLSS